VPETDFATEATTPVIGHLGPGAIDEVFAFVRDENADAIMRSVAAAGLVQIGYHFPDARPALREAYVESFDALASAGDIDGVTALIAAFSTADDAAIRDTFPTAFERNLVDQQVTGHLEYVTGDLERRGPWWSFETERHPLEHFSWPNLKRLAMIETASFSRAHRLASSLLERDRAERRQVATRTKRAANIRKKKRKQERRARKKGRKKKRK
jgi:hypothetical protein